LSLWTDTSSRYRQLFKSESTRYTGERINTILVTQSHHRRNLTRTASDWRKKAAESWLDQVIYADSQRLTSLRDEVEALKNIFMVILHPLRHL
jgi:hypothetical protein